MQNHSFNEFVLDQLSLLPNLRRKTMFGGVGLYEGDQFFGILMGGRLYFRTDARSRPEYLSRGMTPFTYEKNRKMVSLRYFEVPPDVLEDRHELLRWARQAIAIRTRTAVPKLDQGRRPRRP